MHWYGYFWFISADARVADQKAKVNVNHMNTTWITATVDCILKFVADTQQKPQSGGIRQPFGVGVFSTGLTKKTAR